MAPAKKMALEVIKSRNLKIPEPATCVRVQIIDRSDGRVVHKLYEISFAATSDSGAYMVALFESDATEVAWVGSPDARFDVFQFGINDNAFVSKLRRMQEDNKVFLTRRTGPSAAPPALYSIIDSSFALHKILPKTSQHLGHVESLLSKIKAGGVRSLRQFAQLSDITALTIDERFAEQENRFEDIEIDVAQLFHRQREQRNDHEDLAERVGALEREREDDDASAKRSAATAQLAAEAAASDAAAARAAADAAADDTARAFGSIDAARAAAGQAATASAASAASAAAAQEAREREATVAEAASREAASAALASQRAAASAELSADAAGQSAVAAGKAERSVPGAASEAATKAVKPVATAAARAQATADRASTAASRAEVTAADARITLRAVGARTLTLEQQQQQLGAQQQHLGEQIRCAPAPHRSLAQLPPLRLLTVCLVPFASATPLRTRPCSPRRPTSASTSKPPRSTPTRARSSRTKMRSPRSSAPLTR